MFKSFACRSKYVLWYTGFSCSLQPDYSGIIKIMFCIFLMHTFFPHEIEQPAVSIHWPCPGVCPGGKQQQSLQAPFRETWPMWFLLWRVIGMIIWQKARCWLAAIFSPVIHRLSVVYGIVEKQSMASWPLRWKHIHLEDKKHSCR